MCVQLSNTNEGLLFVIDATEQMYEVDEVTGVSFMQAAIRSVLDCVMQRINTNEADLIGVLFYGTVSNLLCTLHTSGLTTAHMYCHRA